MVSGRRRKIHVAAMNCGMRSAGYLVMLKSPRLKYSLRKDTFKSNPENNSPAGMRVTCVTCDLRTPVFYFHPTAANQTGIIPGVSCYWKARTSG
jgi:hypothetical protein